MWEESPRQNHALLASDGPNWVKKDRDHLGLTVNYCQNNKCTYNRGKLVRKKLRLTPSRTCVVRVFQFQGYSDGHNVLRLLSFDSMATSCWISARARSTLSCLHCITTLTGRGRSLRPRPALTSSRGLPECVIPTRVYTVELRQSLDRLPYSSR